MLADCYSRHFLLARAAISTPRSVIDAWMAAGYDPAADILPTLAERTKRKPADPIRTWAFFTTAFAKRHAERAAPAAKPKGAGETGTVAKASTPINPQEVPQRTAAWRNSGRYVPPGAVSNVMRDALLRAGLVTEATLRARQIY